MKLAVAKARLWSDNFDRHLRNLCNSIIRHHINTWHVRFAMCGRPVAIVQTARPVAMPAICISGAAGQGCAVALPRGHAVGGQALQLVQHGVDVGAFPGRHAQQALDQGCERLGPAAGHAEVPVQHLSTCMH
jgi:hypothetical protein